ncbi:MAG: membrane protein insertase YidC, partial [Shewanella fodinae]|nr:membrane protein insertase YidC [Shewanella fodinae]
MESQRNILLIALLAVSFMIWQQWQTDKAPKPAVTETTVTSSNQDTLQNDVPNADSKAGVPEEHPVVASKELVRVKTDQLDVLINPVGGDIVHAALVAHKLEQGKDDPFVLLEQKPGFTYIAQSGLIGSGGIDSSAGRPTYTVASTEFQMKDGNDTLQVPMTYTAPNGVKYTKIFTFRKGKFDIRVDYQIDNTTSAPLQVQMYGQIKQTIKPSDSHMMMPTYRGAAYSTADTRYEKYKFDEITEKDLHKETQGGWVAMLQHYFVSAWVPPADQSNLIYSSVSNGTMANIGFRGQADTVAPGKTATVGADFYVGPKDQAALSELSDTLNLVVDYGVLWWLAVPIYKLMMFFHSFVGNWGLAIILITFTVRGILFPLTRAQYTSMAKMRNLQPKIQELKDRFGDDRQKMGQAMMEMYKKEKVNPMG